MPIKLTIDHARRLVEAKGSGTIVLKEILEYFDSVVTADVSAYRKLLDYSDTRHRLSDDEVMTMGARVSAYDEIERRGPIAVVVTDDETEFFFRRFMNLAPATRPMRVFRSMPRATNWLMATPEA